MRTFLSNYPFSDPAVQLVEGFASYDGVLGDTPGAPHKGIDYILQMEGVPIPFTVHAMHDGVAFHGTSDSWGTFVVIHAPSKGGTRSSSIYAHLASVDPPIAPQFVEQHGQRRPNTAGTLIRAGQLLGRAGTTGWTNNIVQLHIEIHVKSMTGDFVKVDPYGINDTASSGRYPQPGWSLKHLPHLWTTNLPPLAS